jgi:transcriptional regulator with XRE-family HTH domain
MDKVILGKRIREQRELQNLKQEKFAEMVGISNIHMSEIERGKKTPSMEAFIRIVNALNIPADVLLRYEVNGAKHYLLNDITEKMKDLTPEQLKLVVDLFNTALDNFAALERKTEET